MFSVLDKQVTMAVGKGAQNGVLADDIREEVIGHHKSGCDCYIQCEEQGRRWKTSQWVANMEGVKS